MTSDQHIIAAEEIPVAALSMEEIDAAVERLLPTLSPRLDLERIQALSEPYRTTEVRRLIELFLDVQQPPLHWSLREPVLESLLDELLGLGPLGPLMRDPTISEIMVNGSRQLYVEREGRLDEMPSRFRNDDHILQIIERIASRVGRRIDESSPTVDARLPDGSRVNAVIPPVALRGPTLTIRRFSSKPLTADDLVKFKSLTPEMALVLEACVRAKINIIVSGGTGSGKTTLLNCLSGFIPSHERIVTLEDAAELQLQQRHVVPMETRPPNSDGKNTVSMRDLVRNALRMRPDRIVMGEVRGGEALDMLQAMNSGHEGSLTTLHSNSCRDAFSRLETMVMMAGYDMPIRAVRRQIAAAIQLIVQVDRLAGGTRRVTSVTEVVGMEGDVIVSQEIFGFQQQGIDGAGKAFGRFVATGVRPTLATRLKAAGIDLHPHLFQQRLLLQA